MTIDMINQVSSDMQDTPKLYQICIIELHSIPVCITFITAYDTSFDFLFSPEGTETVLQYESYLKPTR
jgi:hypothetical protein